MLGMSLLYTLLQQMIVQQHSVFTFPQDYIPPSKTQYPMVERLSIGEPTQSTSLYSAPATRYKKSGRHGCHKKPTSPPHLYGGRLKKHPRFTP